MIGVPICDSFICTFLNTMGSGVNMPHKNCIQNLDLGPSRFHWMGIQIVTTSNPISVTISKILLLVVLQHFWVQNFSSCPRLWRQFTPSNAFSLSVFLPCIIVISLKGKKSFVLASWISELQPQIFNIWQSALVFGFYFWLRISGILNPILLSCPRLWWH